MLNSFIRLLQEGSSKEKMDLTRGEDGEIGLKVWAVHKVSFCGVLGQRRVA